MADATTDWQRDLAIASRAFVTLLGGDEDDWVGDKDLYLFGDSYKGDNSKDMTSTYRTKRLDFTDQDKTALNSWKTIDKVQLVYRDRSANTPITIYVSDDGGENWVSNTRTLGTGDERTKSADFYFMDKERITSQFFTFKIESVSDDKLFEWNALHVFYEARAEYFEVS